MAFLIVAVFLLTSVSSVASARIGILSNKPDHEDTGEIFSEDISERSVLLIKAEKGVTFFGKHFDTYLPINLPKEFRESGLKVEFSFSVSFLDIFSLSGLSQFIRGILPIKISDIGLIEPEPETNLNFNISLDSTGPARSCIPIKATLKNNGDAKVSVSEMALEVRTLNFNIRTPEGETLEYIGPTERRMPQVVILNPGESIIVEVEDITKEGMFGISGEESYEFKPGVYTIQGHYTSGEYQPTTDVDEIFEGTLESDIKQFELLDESVETKVLTLEADPSLISPEVFTLNPEPIEYLPILDPLDYNTIHALYEKDLEVEITASVEYGKYLFESWQGDATGDENTVTVIMDDDKEITGKYGQEENNEDEVYYKLRIFAFGCGTTSPRPGEHQFLEGEKVDIEAIIPKMDGCEFVQWNGAEIDGSTDIKETVVMDSDKAVTAIFECVPVANFIYSPIEPVAGDEILFTSTSSQTCNEIATYRWDFGDGVTEVLEKPEIKHTYTEGGVYSVKLIVTDVEGKYDSVEKEILVEDTSTEPNNPENGTIQGTITAKGELDSPISDAQVKITPSQMGSADGFLETKTDENGFYSINLPEGEYSIVVIKKGFDRSEKSTEVLSGEISEVNFVLEPVG